MKLCSLLLLAALASPVLPTVNEQTTQTPGDGLTAKEIKRREKEGRKLEERNRKELIRREKLNQKIQRQNERARLVAERNTPASAAYYLPPERVKAALVSKFLATGYAIASDTTYQIIFVRQVTGVSAFFTQLLLGNAYSDPPTEAVAFSFAPEGERTVVRATMQVFVRMPLGNVNSVNMTLNQNWKATVQQLLNNLFGPS